MVRRANLSPLLQLFAVTLIASMGSGCCLFGPHGGYMHHGGMVATDPFGDVIFSDGVFHRSQLETPFGVHRGIDATTYRLYPGRQRMSLQINGRVHAEAEIELTGP